MKLKDSNGDYVFILEKASSNLSVEKRGDDYILEGIAAVFGKENSNNRIYEESEYLPHLEYLNEKITSKRLVGELDHPKDFDVSLKNVSHLIESLTYDKGNRSLKIRVRLLNTPAGKIAQNLVEAGIPISISSRAAGQVNENKRVSIKKIFTYDLVCDPGFPNAQLERVYESMSSFPSFNETIKKPSVIDDLILINEKLGLSENSDSKIYNVTGNDQFLKLLETEDKNKSSYEMKNYVTAEELDEYSLVLKKEFDTIKESIGKIKESKDGSQDSSLEERVKKLETYSSYLAENLENAIKYGDYLSKNLDDAISYSRYLAENLDKSISYGKYLAEHLDRSISYSEYIAESVDNNISKTESISEKLDQTIAYSEYIAENVDRSIGYAEYLAENVDRTIEYSEYLAENVDKSIGYSEYLAEKLDKNISYSEYLAENLSKGISYSEYLAEKIKNNISYSEYIAESVNKITANKLNENVEANYKIDESKGSGFVQDYTGLSGKIDALLESVQKQKTEGPKTKTNTQEVDATLNEGQESSEGSAENPKTGMKFIDEMPEKFKPVWESLNEGQKASLMAQSKFYKLDTGYQINNFWSTRNIGTPVVGLQKLNESENTQKEQPKQAYSNSYVEAIAKALEGKFPNKN